MRFKLLLLLLLVAKLASGQTATLRATVFDEDGEPMVGVPVEVISAKRGALTNENGIVAINKLPAGKLTIRVMVFGYDSLVKEISLNPNEIRSVDLYMSLVTTQVFEVRGERQIDRNRPDIGLTKVDPIDIQRLPSLGTPDLAQYLQVVPGVVFTGDQGGQLYVRGGTPVQNMVLMDGAIIYNPFHSIGLFSIFDTDIIRDVKVYSAGFPAKYGGRVSSVMDISTRNGSFSRLKGKINANTISSGLLLEGPLFKKDQKLANMSYLLSARTLYLDQTSKNLYKYANDTIGLPFNFVDLYGKVTIGNGANRINLFGMYQTDEVNYNYPSSYNWTANGGGFDFLVLPNNTNMILTGNMAITKYKTQQANSSERFPRSSEVGGFTSRLNFSYILNTINQFDMGLQLLGFRTKFRFANSLGLVASNEDNNTEGAFYATYRHVFQSTKTLPNGNTIKFSRFVIEPGLRTHYYNDHSFLAVEPRISTKLNFKGWSIQGTAGRFTQNIISTTSDRDVVVLFQGYLASPDITANKVFNHALQLAEHYMMGLEFDFIKNTNIKIEGWYKDFKQLTNLNRGRLFPEEPTWITEKGSAYGADFIFTYKTKSLYFFASYGWAYNERSDFKINYNPIWDRRHNINLVTTYTRGNIKDRAGVRVLDKRWEFSARVTIGSGFPFTQTQGVFEQIDFFNNGSQANIGTQNGNLGILLSDDYNGARLPDYMRVDISAKRRFRIGREGILELNANVLNLMNRNNIFYFDRILYKRVDQLPLIPTVGVNLSF